TRGEGGGGGSVAYHRLATRFSNVASADPRPMPATLATAAMIASRISVRRRKRRRDVRRRRVRRIGPLVGGMISISDIVCSSATAMPRRPYVARFVYLLASRWISRLSGPIAAIGVALEEAYLLPYPSDAGQSSQHAGVVPYG